METTQEAGATEAPATYEHEGEVNALEERHLLEARVNGVLFRAAMSQATLEQIDRALTSLTGSCESSVARVKRAQPRVDALIARIAEIKSDSTSEGAGLATQTPRSESPIDGDDPGDICAGEDGEAIEAARMRGDLLQPVGMPPAAMSAFLAQLEQQFFEKLSGRLREEVRNEVQGLSMKLEMAAQTSNLWDEPAPASEPKLRVALDDPMPQTRIRKRRGPDKTSLDYVRGQDVIRALNESFGPCGWSDKVLDVEREAWQVSVKGYEDRADVPKKWDALARAVVRLMIHDGVRTCRHEDVGHGQPMGPMASKMHALEMAEKAAVTDALKRCARKLGDRFGLAVYYPEDEREREGMVELPAAPPKPPAAPADPTGGFEFAGMGAPVQAAPAAHPAAKPAAQDTVPVRYPGEVGYPEMMQAGVPAAEAEQLAALTDEGAVEAGRRWHVAAQERWGAKAALALWSHAQFQPGAGARPTAQQVIRYVIAYYTGGVL